MDAYTAQQIIGAIAAFIAIMGAVKVVMSYLDDVGRQWR